MPKTWAELEGHPDLKNMIQSKWPLLVSGDAIDTQEHLVASVQLRYALAPLVAEKQVADWLDGMNWADAPKTWPKAQDKDFKAAVKARWGKLTDADITDISTQDKLASAVAKRYEMNPQDATWEVSQWVADKNYGE